VDACNPLLQAHPTWARDEHEGRGISTSLTPVSGHLSPPSRSASRRPIWAGARGDISLVGPGTPRSRNADKTAKTVRHNVHIVECDQSSSDDESTEVYAAEMIWPKQAKSLACSSLQPVQKKRQEEVKFIFNVGKCDKIFDELLKNGNIKMNHTVPSADELKRRAYCKWHNSFSHATNDCNVFHRQIQSVINEGRLKFQKMQVDTEPFPMNMIDFEGKKFPIRPSTADKGQGKEIVIENAREVDGNHKISCRKVVAEKTPDGGETLKVTITARGNPFCASRTVRHPDADGPKLLRTVRRLLADGPATLRTHNNHVHSNHDDQR
jgi:hypothetical protein